MSDFDDELIQTKLYLAQQRIRNVLPHVLMFTTLLKLKIEIDLLVRKKLFNNFLNKLAKTLKEWDLLNNLQPFQERGEILK